MKASRTLCSQLIPISKFLKSTCQPPPQPLVSHIPMQWEQNPMRDNFRNAHFLVPGRSTNQPLFYDPNNAG
jgi:hypothetical protein